MENQNGNSATPERAASSRVEVEQAQGSNVMGRPSTLPFFGVYFDPRTWSALLFVFLSLVTGIVYFTWVVTGLSLSIGFLILIIGLPFALVFLMSVRGLAWLDAQLVGALLGTRIERPPATHESGEGLLGRLKGLVMDNRTWVSLLHLILQLPMGVIYFTLTTIWLSFSLGLMALPFAFWLGDPQVVTFGAQRLALRGWLPIVMEIIGFLMLTISLHMVRGIGQFHARYAKALLGR